MEQPQLLHIALVESDVVYTPDWVAHDMAEYFHPSGRILDPCRGDGAFTKYLPRHTEWCEIDDGRDFFAWTDPVDWLVGNPPYAIFSKWLSHSMDIAQNILYLIPCNKPFNSSSMLKSLMEWGGIKHMRVYGGGARLGFPIGFAIGALWFQRGYSGGMEITLFGGQG